MATKPVAKVFAPLDTLFWALLCIVPTGLALAATLTKQDPPIPTVAWVILWAVVAGFWGITIIYFAKRAALVRTLRFLDKHNITVGWKSAKYAVSAVEFEQQVDLMLEKVTKKYPDASKALFGTIVMFVEPTFLTFPTPGVVARKVAGVQDGMLMTVGWDRNLDASALAHELTHRVLQVYAGDPSEEAAHAEMASLGIL